MGPLSRRRVLVGAGTALAGALIAPRLHAAEDNLELSAAEMFTAPAKQAAERGLHFLAKQQIDDGSFGNAGYSHNVAVCALAGMAFMSSGSTPDRGPFGKSVSRALEYLLANEQKIG